MHFRHVKSARRVRTRQVLSVVAVFPFLVSLQQTSIANATCESDIRIVSKNDKDAMIACEAAKSASLFLQELGLDRKKPLRIEIVKSPSPAIPERAYGCYDFTSEIVSVLSFSDCLKVSEQKPPYGIALTREMYKSFFVHEVGHAIVAANRAGNSVSRLAHECIAYITQFGVMKSKLRKEILDRFEYLSISSPAELSTLTYLLSPDVFAIKCYKHFLARKDKRGFLKALLSGDIELQPRNVHP